MPLVPKLANAYVPFQMNTDMYSAEEGLMRHGTMFEALYSPFKGNVKGSDVICK